MQVSQKFDNKMQTSLSKQEKKDRSTNIQTANGNHGNQTLTKGLLAFS